MIDLHNFAAVVYFLAFAGVFAIGAACMYCVIVGCKAWMFMDRGYGLGEAVRMARSELQ